jgi:hypothetical protein
MAEYFFQSIFLNTRSCHTDFFNFKEKRSLAASKGVDAYIDPEGYRQRIAKEKINLEAGIRNETALKDRP